VLLLHVFAYVVLLVVLPLLVVYFVELSMKTNYLRQKQRRQQQQQEGSDAQRGLVQQLQFSPMVDSAWVRIVVSYACVVGAFYACSTVVTLLSPVTCSSSDGSLVFGRAAASFSGSSATSNTASISTEL
jgi:heme exporter protein D